MFSRFRLWIKTDPHAIRKLVIAVIGISISVFTIFIFFLINNDTSTPTEVSNTTNQSLGFDTEVTLNSFESSTRLEKVDNVEVGLPDKVFFIPGGEVGFLNNNYKLQLGGMSYPESPAILPLEINTTGDNLIFNSIGSSTRFTNSEGFVQYPENKFQVTPYLIPDDLGLDFVPGYLYLSTNNSGQYSINQSTKADLSNPNNIATFELTPGLGYVEIKIISGSPYLIMYEGLVPEGIIEIWKLDGENLQKITTLDNVNSLIFGPDSILYTTNSNNLSEITNYQNSYINFKSGDPEGRNLNIETRLVQNNILGALTARRCDFDILNNLYCLIKEKKVNSDIYQLRDVLVKINPESNEISRPLQGLNFSAASLKIANNGTIYLVGQENNILYQIKS